MLDRYRERQRLDFVEPLLGVKKWIGFLYYIFLPLSFIITEQKHLKMKSRHHRSLKRDIRTNSISPEGKVVAPERKNGPPEGKIVQPE
ncbi:hypothetical protein HNQ41_000609 [Texcoconibacillus texcoconensis]|uniref:Uncharacterized protein n=1 Tax=Texcoconibacillus texcoconensis TaxID=1095777 RepID=A0A840QM57_9BACI|nr:hypothetical protein [Texcoconibacillus texcoconensis]